MKTYTISRSDFKAVIDAARAKWADSPARQEQAPKLDDVTENADRVAFGRTFLGEACPALKAGLLVGGFGDAFDRALKERLGIEGYGVLEIKEEA